MTSNTELSTRRDISVVMLTLDEEAAVAKVVSDILAILPHAEIVVVDSGTDKTAQIAADLGCIVVRQHPPQGYGMAMDAGFKAASHQYIVTVDCDDTYPPEAIRQLVDVADQGFDLVSASRLENRPDSMPFGNYVANKVFAIIAVFLCGVSTSDVHTGMRLYRKSLLESFKYDPIGMALPVEMQVGPARLGYRCTEIFISYRPRIGESTLLPVPGTIWTLRRLWRWRRFLNAAVAPR